MSARPMRFLAVDWGTSRLRAYRVADGAVVDEASSDDGIGRLQAGQHEAAFAGLCGAWLKAEPGLPVILAGMVGSREGWVQAPYAECPAGPSEIAAAAREVEIGGGGAARGLVVPGLLYDDGHGPDVMRGEETHLIGSGVTDGLVCLPGTHCKWAEMRGGRVRRFASFITGELHGLLLEHSMIGRPASEPADPAGFGAGLDAAAERGGGGSLLNGLFRARAATVTGRIGTASLGPHLSGLPAGFEVAGALRLFGVPTRVTVVADEARADLYRQALARHGVPIDAVPPRRTFLAGIARILEQRHP